MERARQAPGWRPRPLARPACQAGRCRHRWEQSPKERAGTGEKGKQEGAAGLDQRALGLGEAGLDQRACGGRVSGLDHRALGWSGRAGQQSPEQSLPWGDEK